MKESICSFNVTRQQGQRFTDQLAPNYNVDKITCDGKNYIVVISSHGVAICPEK